ncbi:pyruvate formate lyase activating enzyme [Ferrimonas marina]|uniref:Pyruvate formate lyase activating enzyme n=2 Tax=Ferrimonas marina TaxID=299255 RepID=A0A1M5Z4X0_9GAMM|nr:pyruvate formate lyase activating enzyme [Ferrimonas marina]
MPDPLLGVISHILPFSCVDGPGSRMVVFLQGCNMDCPGCQNPHTIGHCDGCLSCVESCPNQALSPTGAPRQRQLDAQRCQQCDHCISQCPRSGNPRSQVTSVEALLATIRTHAPLLDGVTFSGGEATLQHRFLAALMARLKADPQCAHLSLLIDSNGLLAPQHWPALLAHCDGVMIDIKAMEATLHRQLTGRDPQRVIRSIEYLAAQQKLTELRWLVVQGLNDTEAEFTALCELLKALPQSISLRLNGYRHHGVREAGRQWPQTDSARLQALAQQLAHQGISSHCVTA